MQNYPSSHYSSPSSHYSSPYSNQEEEENEWPQENEWTQENEEDYNNFPVNQVVVNHDYNPINNRYNYIFDHIYDIDNTELLPYVIPMEICNEEGVCRYGHLISPDGDIKFDFLFNMVNNILDLFNNSNRNRIDIDVILNLLKEKIRFINPDNRLIIREMINEFNTLNSCLIQNHIDFNYKMRTISNSIFKILTLIDYYRKVKLNNPQSLFKYYGIPNKTHFTLDEYYARVFMNNGVRIITPALQKKIDFIDRRTIECPEDKECLICLKNKKNIQKNINEEKYNGCIYLHDEHFLCKACALELLLRSENSEVICPYCRAKINIETNVVTPASLGGKKKVVKKSTTKKSTTKKSTTKKSTTKKPVVKKSTTKKPTTKKPTTKKLTTKKPTTKKPTTKKLTTKKPVVKKTSIINKVINK